MTEQPELTPFPPISPDSRPYSIFGPAVHHHLMPVLRRGRRPRHGETVKPASRSLLQRIKRRASRRIPAPHRAFEKYRPMSIGDRYLAELRVGSSDREFRARLPPD